MIDSPLSASPTSVPNGKHARVAKVDAGYTRGDAQNAFAQLVGRVDTALSGPEAKAPAGVPDLKMLPENGFAGVFGRDAKPRISAEPNVVAAPAAHAVEAMADAADGEGDPVIPTDDTVMIETLENIPASTPFVILSDADLDSGVTVGLAKAVEVVSAAALPVRRTSAKPLAPAALKAVPMPLQVDQPTVSAQPGITAAQPFTHAMTSADTTAITANLAPPVQQETAAQVPKVLRISLRPAELGPVQVVIHTGTEGTTVRIVAETDAGYAALVNKGDVLASLVRDLRAATVLPTPETGQQPMAFGADGQGGGRGLMEEMARKGADRRDAGSQRPDDANDNSPQPDSSQPVPSSRPLSYRTI